VFWQAVQNSAIIAVVATALAVVLGSMAAFALSRYAFRGRDGLFLLFTARLLFPLNTAALPLFLMLQKIGMPRRGPVRGPRHPRTRCNQRHQRHGSVPSVQVVRTMHEAVLLIIRRSWVRAPPAPPVTSGRMSTPPSKGARRRLRPRIVLHRCV
jgi:hypothetical protein